MNLLSARFVIIGVLAGTAFAQSPCTISSQYPGSYICNVDGSTGVTANKYVKYNPGATGVVIGATTDSHSLIGIANATQTGGGGMLVTRYGPMLAAFDAATTAGDYCQESTATYSSSPVAGDLHDSGTTRPGGPVTCRVMQTIGSAGNAWVDLFGPDTVGLSGSPFVTLTDAATVTWAMNSNPFGNATLTFTVHSGSRTLNITNPVDGGSYVLNLIQDATGGEGLTLGTGCTWKVLGGGGGGVTPSTGANAQDVLAFTYHASGTYCIANFAKNAN